MPGLRCICILSMLSLLVTNAWGAGPPGVLSHDIKTTLKDLSLLYGDPVTDVTFDSKVVIVTFFASWCPPCREEFGHLKQLYTEYHQSGLEVIAVNLFEDFDNFSNDKRLAAFLNLTKPPFTVVKGNEIVSQQFGAVLRIPTLFIFNRQGRRVLRFANEVGGQQMTLDVEVLRHVVAQHLRPTASAMPMQSIPMQPVPMRPIVEPTEAQR